MLEDRVHDHSGKGFLKILFDTGKYRCTVSKSYCFTLLCVSAVCK